MNAVRMLVGALGFLVACGGMWEAVRRNDQRLAAEHARELMQTGDCESALERLERAQAHPDLGPFAGESTWLKARCLERLGRGQEALAHWRMLEDLLQDSEYARRIPPPARQELGIHDPLPAQPIPPGLQISEPRYSRAAERSHLAGSVVIRFRLRGDGTVDEIRVIETPHVLLGSWTIEAVANAQWRPKSSESVGLPLRATSRFRFESHWAGFEASDPPE